MPPGQKNYKKTYNFCALKLKLIGLADFYSSNNAQIYSQSDYLLTYLSICILLIQIKAEYGNYPNLRRLLHALQTFDKNTTHFLTDIIN